MISYCSETELIPYARVVRGALAPGPAREATLEPRPSKSKHKGHTRACRLSRHPVD